MSTKNIWLLTEERPKRVVVKTILEKFVKDNNVPYSAGDIKIIPVIENNKFKFRYEVTGFNSKFINLDLIKNLKLKIIITLL